MGYTPPAWSVVPGARGLGVTGFQSASGIFVPASQVADYDSTWQISGGDASRITFTLPDRSTRTVSLNVKYPSSPRFPPTVTVTAVVAGKAPPPNYKAWTPRQNAWPLYSDYHLNSDGTVTMEGPVLYSLLAVPGFDPSVTYNISETDLGQIAQPNGRTYELIELSIMSPGAPLPAYYYTFEGGGGGNFLSSALKPLSTLVNDPIGAVKALGSAVGAFIANPSLKTASGLLDNPVLNPIGAVTQAGTGLTPTQQFKIGAAGGALISGAAKAIHSGNILDLKPPSFLAGSGSPLIAPPPPPVFIVDNPAPPAAPAGAPSSGPGAPVIAVLGAGFAVLLALLL